MDALLFFFKFICGIFLSIAAIVVLVWLLRWINYFGVGRYPSTIRQEMEGKEIIKAVIAAHIKALSIKKRQTVLVDAYGNRVVRRWRKEQDYFIETVLRAKVSYKNWPFAGSRPIYDLIDQAVDEFESAPEQQASSLMQKIDSKMSSKEYKHHCASLLSGLGWAARVKRASGDQSVDVIAEKGGQKLIIQCKKYSNPVGNKPVEEVIAAMKIEDADFAAVVSNSAFTLSARELANKCGILLLHHSELDRLDKLVDEPVDQFEYAPEQQASLPIQAFDSSIPQEEYEQYCLGLLRGLGWTTHMTEASGNRGIGILAEKGGQKLVIEFKQCSIPVEDKALREMIGGMKIKDTYFAAVVCNSSFTPSALDLADKIGILLLHHSELNRLDELFSWRKP